MEVNAIRRAGIANAADFVAGIDFFSTAHVHFREVGIKRLPAEAVVHDHHIPVTPVVPTGINHNAVIHCRNWVSHVSTEIDAKMVG